MINFDSYWDKFLFLVEFLYHEIYHLSIEMISFEALCSTRFDLYLIGLIQDRFLMVQSTQQSYADRKVHDLEFMVRE